MNYADFFAASQDEIVNLNEKKQVGVYLGRARDLKEFPGIVEKSHTSSGGHKFLTITSSSDGKTSEFREDQAAYLTIEPKEDGKIYWKITFNEKVHAPQSKLGGVLPDEQLSQLPFPIDKNSNANYQPGERSSDMIVITPEMVDKFGENGKIVIEDFSPSREMGGYTAPGARTLVVGDAVEVDSSGHRWKIGKEELQEKYVIPSEVTAKIEEDKFKGSAPNCLSNEGFKNADTKKFGMFNNIINSAKQKLGINKSGQNRGL